MIINDGFHDEELDHYILSDQPTICGKCGARTDFEELNGELQKHQCLNANCGYIFFAAGDDLINGLV